MFEVGSLDPVLQFYNCAVGLVVWGFLTALRHTLFASHPEG